MAYATLADMLQAESAQQLIMLSEDAPSGDDDFTAAEKAGTDVTARVTIINTAITGADDEIKTYLYGGYDTDFPSGTPSMIKQISIKGALYRLFRRNASKSVPDSVRQDYEDSISRLKDIRAGRITLFDIKEESTRDRPTFIRHNKNGETKCFTKTVLDKMP